MGEEIGEGGGEDSTVFGRIARRGEVNVVFEGGESFAAGWGVEHSGEEREVEGAKFYGTEGVAFDHRLQITGDGGIRV